MTNPSATPALTIFSSFSCIPTYLNFSIANFSNSFSFSIFTSSIITTTSTIEILATSSSFIKANAKVLIKHSRLHHHAKITSCPSPALTTSFLFMCKRYLGSFVCKRLFYPIISLCLNHHFTPSSFSLIYSG